VHEIDCRSPGGFATLSRTGALSGVVHAIGSNIESNRIRSLSLIQAVEVKSGTAVAAIRIASAMAMLMRQARQYSRCLSNGVSSSRRALERPIRAATPWYTEPSARHVCEATIVCLGSAMGYQDILKCRSRKLSTQVEHKRLGALLIAESSQRWRRLGSLP
jgi:hypothetical protein